MLEGALLLAALVQLGLPMGLLVPSSVRRVGNDSWHQPWLAVESMRLSLAVDVVLERQRWQGVRQAV